MIPTFFYAHPPSSENLPPTKSAPLIKKAKEAKKKGDLETYNRLLTQIKKQLVEEGRYSCCISGGCEECTLEGVCGCAANLYETKGICQNCLDGYAHQKGRYEVGKDKLFLQKMQEDSQMATRMMSDYTVRGNHTMGRGFLTYTTGGGKRGRSEFYGTGWGMRLQDSGKWTLRGMASIDPATVGGRGYPDLFQTGETYKKQLLRDRQHPHDLLMEVAAVYQHKNAFAYLAPVGEPAMGFTAFAHRPSAWDNPNAPITHHNFDGTHITFGVVNVGVDNKNKKWRLETSLFTGREPDENRWNIDKIRLDSQAVRLQYRPSGNSDTRILASYAFLKKPEILENGNITRTILGAQHARGSVSSLIGYSLTHKKAKNQAALLLESALTTEKQSYFVRYENVLKDELIVSGNYNIQKASIGGVSRQGIGMSVDFFAYPKTLRPVYGSPKPTLSIFYRLKT
jgi:hypothetical protein